MGAIRFDQVRLQVQGYFTKVAMNESLEPITAPLTKRAMVVGAGISGIQAALDIANAGYEVARTKGSHHFLLHPDGHVTVVPVHSGEIVGPGLLAKILRDCDLTPEQFEALL